MSGTLKRLAGENGALLETLYAASFDTPLWSRFLEQLVDITDSRSARMLVMDRKAETVLSSLKHNIDDNAHRDYVEHFVNTCPWRPELRFKAPGKLYSTYFDFSCQQKAFYQTEFFNDWAGEQDIHHGACGTVWQNEDITVQLLIQRTGGQGFYSREETDRINDLVPHIRQSLRLARQINSLRIGHKALEQSLNRYSIPFAVADHRGTIRYLSSEAKAIIDETEGLRVQDGKLAPEGYRPSGRLRRLLSECCRRSGDHGFGAGGIVSIDRAGLPPLHCLVSPSPAHLTADMLWQGEGSPLAVIYFQDPCAQRHIDENLLAQMFELSDAESAVAADIARGRSPEEIASTRSSSIHTVRTQLKAVLRKTGCRRQSELTNVIVTSLASHCVPDTPITLEGDSE